MRKTVQKLVAALLLISAMSLVARPQTRVRFAKGRYSTTVTGFLGSEERKIYVIGGKRGQRMTLRLRSFGATVIVSDGEGNEKETGLLKETVDYEFSQSGDVNITVYKPGGGGTEYSLKVTVR